MARLPIPTKILRDSLSAVLMAGPILWIFLRMDSARFLKALLSFPALLLVIVIVIFAFLYFLQGVRLWMLLRPFVSGLSFGLTLKVHVKSIYYSIVLPVAAQDILRAALLSKEYEYQHVWSATWIGKVLTLLGFTFVAAVGSFFVNLSALPPWVLRSAMIVVVIIPIVLLLSFSKSTTRVLRPALTRILPRKAVGTLESIREGIFLYRNKTDQLLYVALLTVFIHVVTVLNATIILYGIVSEWHFAEMLFFIPVIEMLVVSLPFTPNGIGMREGFVSFFFLRFLGTSSEQLGVYVTICFSAIVLKLLGIIPVAFEKAAAGASHRTNAVR